MNEQNKDKLAIWLMNCRLFRNLSQSDLKNFTDSAEWRLYRKNDIISSSRQHGNGIFVIVDGVVRVTLHDAEGHERVISYLSAPDYFGTVFIFGGRVDTDVIAHTGLNVIFIPKGQVLKLAKKISKFSLALLQGFASQLNTTRRELNDVSFKSIEGRVAVKLLKLAYKFGQPVTLGCRITLSLTHGDLADLIGTNRETVTRVLGAFRKINAIMIDQCRHIVIMDPKKIESYITGQRKLES